MCMSMQVSIHQPNLEDIVHTNQVDVLRAESESVSSDSTSPIDGESDIDDTGNIEKWPLETTNGPHCEAVFGNGFSKEMLSCSTAYSSFKCLQNPFSNQMYCEALNFILNPSMITISDGGEDIHAVAGRKEDVEFPRFEHDASTGDTAFNVDCEPRGDIPLKNGAFCYFVPILLFWMHSLAVLNHRVICCLHTAGVSYYISDIVQYLRNTGVGNTDSVYHDKYLSDHRTLCQEGQMNKVTIFLVTMRYEYANMYHQATDWYNFYQVEHALVAVAVASAVPMLRAC